MIPITDLKFRKKIQFVSFHPAVWQCQNQKYLECQVIVPRPLELQDRPKRRTENPAADGSCVLHQTEPSASSISVALDL